MKIHAVQTGVIRLTASWQQGVGHGGEGAVRLAGRRTDGAVEWRAAA